MGGGVSKVDVADMHKAVLAVLKRGPLDDSIRLLKQNANIRYREEHGHKPLQDSAGQVITPVDEIVLSGEQLNKYRRGAGGTARLASALAADKFVHSVLLDSCGITVRDLHAFCQAPSVLAVHPRITSLDLSSNEIAGIATDGSGSFDPTALRVLCDALCGNAGLLTELNLSHNVLAAPGAVILADMLVQHHGLQMLNVEGCALEDEGKRALGTALLRKAAAIEAKECEEVEQITAAAAAAAAKADSSHHHHHHRLGRRRSSNSAFAAKEAERQRRKAAARDKKAREALRARVRRSWAKADAARRSAFESAGRRFESDAKKRRKEAIKKLPSEHKKELAHVKKLAAAEAKAAKRVRDRVERAKRAALKKKAKALEQVRKQKEKNEANRRSDLAKARAQLGSRPSLSEVRWVEGMEVEVIRLSDAVEQAKEIELTPADEAGSHGGDGTAATSGTSAAEDDVGETRESQNTNSGDDAKAALDMLKAEDELLKEHEHEPCPHRTGIGVLAVVHNDSSTADVNFHVPQPQQDAGQTRKPSLMQPSGAGNASAESGQARLNESKPGANSSGDVVDTAMAASSGDAVGKSDGDVAAGIAIMRLRPANWEQQLAGWEARDKELQQQEGEMNNEADAAEDINEEDDDDAGANDSADGESGGEDGTQISVAQAVAEAAEAALQGFPSIQRCEQEIEQDRIVMEEERGEEPQRVEMDDEELDEHLGLGPLGSDLQTRALELLRRPGRNGALEGPGGRWPQLRLIRCDEFDLGALGDEVEELDLFQERLAPADAVLLGGMLIGNDTVMAIDLSSNPICGRYWDAGEGAVESSFPFRGEFDASGIEALSEALAYEILPPPPPLVLKKKKKEETKDDDGEEEGTQEGSDSAEDENDVPQHDSDGGVPVPPEPLGYGRVRSLSIANVGLVSRRFGNHGPVSFAALDALSAALVTNTSLTFLDLSSNGVVGDWRGPAVGSEGDGDTALGTGVLGFANALRRNSTLMTLDVSDNAASLDARGDAKAADEEAITAICDALIRRDIFQKEYGVSRDTRPGDDRADDGKVSKCGLTALNLAHNYIKGSGARALARALPFSILEILDISQNRVGASPSALAELGDALRRAPDLTSLNISHNLLALDACDGVADVYGGESAAAGAVRPRRAFCCALAENTLLEELNEDNIGTRAAQKHQAEADREEQQALQVWGAPQLPEISEEQLLDERATALEQCLLRAENETHARESE